MSAKTRTMNSAVATLGYSFGDVDREPSEGVAARQLSKRIDARRASILLDQQMWLFGQDVRHPDGNLLIRYGCLRDRDPGDTISAYTHRPEPNAEIVLWSFGLFFGIAGRGGVFIRRYAFRPRWTPNWRLARHVWNIEDLTRQTSAVADSEAASELLCRTALWIAAYEDRTQETAGMDYRRDCIEHWRRNRRIPAESIALEWRTIAAATGGPPP